MWKQMRFFFLPVCKETYTYVVFSQLDFDGLGVRADRSLCVQSGVCVV